RRSLSAAQRGYERHKILTYPRTDSRCLPEEYRDIVDDTLAALAGAADHPGDGFAEFAAHAAHLQRAGLQNQKRTFNDAGVSDHFAIIPTGTLPAEVLTGDDKRLFDLIVRRFLGNFYPPAVWERVERTTEVEGERFRTRARFLQERGWRVVLPAVTEEQAGELAPLSPGQAAATGIAITTREVEVEDLETRPPARITEARLLSLMENAGQLVEDEEQAAMLNAKGLGTPATRADIIENLIAKSYVVRCDKALRPSVKGIRLIDTLNRIHIERLTSPGLTGEIEFHLGQVERGTRSGDDFMREITEYACEIVDVAKTFEYDELYDSEDVLGDCPSCGGPVVEYAWFYRCKQKPGVEREDDCAMRFWKDTSGRYLDRNTIRVLLEHGRAGPIDGFTARNGRTYKGNLEIDEEAWQLKVHSLGFNEGEGVSDTPEYEVNEESLGSCPICKQRRVIETSTHFRCEPTPEQVEAAERAVAEKAARAEAYRTAVEAAQKAGLPPPKKQRAKRANVDASDAPCPFVFPRTVCKREITRDEAEYYIQNERTELLEEFTSRFGRPFAATLVLKPNGRHGFEFRPREPRAAGAGGRKQAATRAGSKQPRKSKRAKTVKQAKTRKQKLLKAEIARKKDLEQLIAAIEDQLDARQYAEALGSIRRLKARAPGHRLLGRFTRRAERGMLATSVRQVLRRLDQALKSGNVEELKKLFHPSARKDADRLADRLAALAGAVSIIISTHTHNEADIETRADGTATVAAPWRARVKLTRLGGRNIDTDWIHTLTFRKSDD
ncbi:MAG: topoisomerase C-terminal repeat-containing protein, partial [Myxococcales bacterium]|nr:topoisomerase C-terminal repeat-containing protein [Myxococcales bacterium]